MNVIEELKKTVPETRQEKLGDFDVYRFETVTPAFTFENVLVNIGEQYLIQIIAKDSFDEELAIFLLKYLEKIDFNVENTNKLTVLNVKYPSNWEFNTLVITPPAIAERFKHQSDVLGKVTFWVFPAFDGEFTSEYSKKEFNHQLGRKDGWRTDISNWNRKPKTEPIWD